MGKYRDHRQPRDHDPGGDQGSDDSEPSYFQRQFVGQSPRSQQPVPAAAPKRPPLEAEVLWFNVPKGFGFVRLADGSEAYLHQTKLQAGGHGGISEGTRLSVMVETGPKGPQVCEVIAVIAAGDRQPYTRPPAPAEQKPVTELQPQECAGAVKWYDATKGFGFIKLEDGGGEVFVHATALARSGLTTLDDGQKVVVSYIQGKKGLEVKVLRLG